MMWWFILFVIIVTVVLLALAFYLYKPDPPPAVPQKELPEPIAGTQGMCTFEGEDIFNNKIHDYNGTLVKPDTNVPCSNCNQYVFKDSDGCISLGYDKRFGSGVCTAGFLNSSGNWGIPVPKKCPFS